MNPDTRAAAISHALAAYPKESCGLVIIHDGVEEYYACRNIALTKSEHFVLSPEDYADAEDRGEITAVVHSHPDASPKPSEADRVSCERSGLPWFIYAIHRDVVTGDLSMGGEYAWEPNGYEAPLVGREFAYGTLDCLELIRDYYQRELGITLPEYEHRDGWWDRGETLYMDRIAAAGFEPIVGKPQKGDLILMQIRSKTPNHAGVYLGDGLFLHHLYGRLSSRDVYGGYWAEVTRQIVRRKPE